MTAVFAVYGAELPSHVLRDAPGIIDRCEAPEAVKTVLKKGVAWELEDRYPSVDNFCQALEQKEGQAQAVRQRCCWLRDSIRGIMSLGVKTARKIFSRPYFSSTY